MEWYVAFFSFNDKRRHLQTENVRAEEIVRCVSLLAVTRFMLGIKTQKRASTFQFPFLNGWENITKNDTPPPIAPTTLEQESFSFSEKNNDKLYAMLAIISSRRFCTLGQSNVSGFSIQGTGKGIPKQ